MASDTSRQASAAATGKAQTSSDRPIPKFGKSGINDNASITPSSDNIT